MSEKLTEAVTDAKYRETNERNEMSGEFEALLYCNQGQYLVSC